MRIPSLGWSSSIAIFLILTLVSLRFVGIEALVSPPKTPNCRTDSANQMHVVIAGAGIVGTATAYYLASNHGIRSTLVDPTGQIAPAASGKAAGFLAKDWNDRSPTEALTQRSFDLHQSLAERFGAESIQYRRLTCASIAISDNVHNKPASRKLENVEWVNNVGVSNVRILGTKETIAQVHPKLLCERLYLEASRDDKCRLVQGTVVQAVHNKDKSLRGAQLDNGTILEADCILFACGPWTKHLLGVKYHSVVVPTPSIYTQCVFFSTSRGDPEAYVRPDQTAYLTGFPEAPQVVKEAPGSECVDPERITAIREGIKQASGGVLDSLGHGESVVEQACYLPTTDNGIPVMGSLKEDGCYVAAGHSCWGILLGPATGESMASLIATGKETEHVKLQNFDPTRYSDLQPRTVPS